MDLYNQFRQWLEQSLADEKNPVPAYFINGALLISAVGLILVTMFFASQVFTDIEIPEEINPTRIIGQVEQFLPTPRSTNTPRPAVTVVSVETPIPFVQIPQNAVTVVTIIQEIIPTPVPPPPAVDYSPPPPDISNGQKVCGQMPQTQASYIISLYRGGQVCEAWSETMGAMLDSCIRDGDVGEGLLKAIGALGRTNAGWSAAHDWFTYTFGITVNKEWRTANGCRSD